MKVIHVARKPLEGTVAESVLAHGTGAVNIDASRLAHTESLEFLSNRSGRKAGNAWADMGIKGKPHSYEANKAGRWPPNVILQGEPVAAAIDEQSGLVQACRQSDGAHPFGNAEDSPYRQWKEVQEAPGGASRYFKQVGDKTPDEPT